MSLFQPNSPIFYHGHDHIAIEKLLVLRTGLGKLKSQRKKTFDANKVMRESSTTKIDPISNSEPHTYFTEHLVCMTQNSPQEYDENQKNSSLDLTAQEHDRLSPITIHTQSENQFT
jgi:hypothetical protein